MTEVLGINPHAPRVARAAVSSAADRALGRSVERLIEDREAARG